MSAPLYELVTQHRQLQQLAKAAGVTRWSARAVMEIMRWESALREQRQDSLKLNSTGAGIQKIGMPGRNES